MKNRIDLRCAAVCAAVLLGSTLASREAFSDPLKSLTVCADPGNMPLSNNKGEGFENKIAQVIGAALGTGVQYYWRPSIERGLMRTTLSEGNCDMWMDMAADTEGAVILEPALYRSTFVLAYRNDKGISIKSLDDPSLKSLRVGVFQVSAIREALSEHRVVGNTVVHYLSHNADIVEENQPSYQVQQVIDGTLDVAAVWGPMAGYFKTIKKAPVTVQPVNLMEDQIPMEFDMSLAVPRGRPDIKAAIEGALVQHKAEIRQILVDFGVPLVKCDQCIVAGDLPSHGPYKEEQPPPQQTAAEITALRRVKMAEMKKSLAAGASPNSEMGEAIVANDVDRVRYLLAHGADINARDGEYMTPLINAARYRLDDMATYLAQHKADVNLTDRDQWTALTYAAWVNDPELIKVLISNGAKLEARDTNEMTPLAIACQNDKVKAAQALIAAGADINATVAKGGYTPLMLASVAGSSDIANALIARGAKVNAVNPGGVTALMIAVAGNHSANVQLLLKAGADLNARSQDGRTALSIAQSNSNDALVQLLQNAMHQTPASSG